MTREQRKVEEDLNIILIKVVNKDTSFKEVKRL
jgi:hypothetical protein